MYCMNTYTCTEGSGIIHFDVQGLRNNIMHLKHERCRQCKRHRHRQNSRSVTMALTPLAPTQCRVTIIT